MSRDQFYAFVVFSSPVFVGQLFWAKAMFLNVLSNSGSVNDLGGSPSRKTGIGASLREYFELCIKRQILSICVRFVISNAWRHFPSPWHCTQGSEPVICAACWRLLDKQLQPPFFKGGVCPSPAQLRHCCLSFLMMLDWACWRADPQEMKFPLVQKPLHFRGEAEKEEWMVAANKKIQEADAFVTVTAEYNRCIAPALTNMIDHFRYRASAIDQPPLYRTLWVRLTKIW